MLPETLGDQAGAHFLRVTLPLPVTAQKKWLGKIYKKTFFARPCKVEVENPLLLPLASDRTFFFLRRFLSPSPAHFLPADVSRSD